MNKKVLLISALMVVIFLSIFSWVIFATPWQKWYSTEADRAKVLPGYELVPKPAHSSVMAIDINAAPDKVWPWINQMGQDRGGLYSHEWLENIFGTNMKNSNIIKAEWQYKGKKDEYMKLDPRIPGIPLALHIPGKVIAFNGGTFEKHGRQIKAGQAVPKDYFNNAWILYLEDIGGGKTRLYSVWRYDYYHSFANDLGYGPNIVGLLNFIMSDAMLRGIKARAEKGNAI